MSLLKHVIVHASMWIGLRSMTCDGCVRKERIADDGCVKARISLQQNAVESTRGVLGILDQSCAHLDGGIHL